MKKFLTLLSLIFVMFIFVSCVSDDDEEEGVSGDTAQSDTTPSGDTDPADTGDTTPSEQGDTTPSDPTAPSDPTNPTNPTDPNCQPDCTGKQCGSDGCGGVCGTCGANEMCNLNNFTCQCNPKCDGTHCGDDGCGGTCSCQNQGDVCDPDTKVCTCFPSCDGKQCGNDGCGGSCGSCTGGLVCDAGECVPSTCVDSTCEGKVCGVNGCGESCGDCGNPHDFTCSIDQTQCLSCSCEGRECGTNGCGGICGNNGGNCPEGQGCSTDGKCITCSCDGKKCGKNECGKDCGTGCGYDEMCNADQTGCNKCDTISLKDLVHTSSSDPANGFYDYTAEYAPNSGSSKNHFSFRMYNPPHNYIKFDELPFSSCTLDKPNNANNACAFIKEYEGDIITRLYYPQKGIITVLFNSNGSFYAPVDQQLVLTEVDKVTGEVISGGKCFRITNSQINAKGK
ncbi:hypothetical protein J6253_04570 [bacterium]|nr:hypothetical protein [bacterium]MBP5590236.1 hypothetical protein [bacterium]